MSLADLIRGVPEPITVATATVATVATDENDGARTVAKVAKVAVASCHATENDAPATTNRAWRIGQEGIAKDGTPTMAWIESTFSPPATMAQLRSWYPDAVAFEPVIDDRRPPEAVTGEDAKDWTAMVEDVSRHLLGHGVEIGPVLERMTSDELADWRAGWFGPDEVRAFAGVVR